MRPSRVAAAAMAGLAGAFAPVAIRAQEHAGEAAGSGIFSVNLGLLFWTWVLFLATLAILAWKVFPAISGGLEERHRKIQAAIDEARLAREQAQALRAEQQQALESARRDAQQMIEKARQAADGVRKEILAEARAQHEAMLADARRELDQERERLREELRRDAVEISLAAAERLIRTRLDTDENRRLVHEFLSELDG